MRFRRLLPLALLLGAVVLVRADQPAYDESEFNRLQLEKWKRDQPHYARLRKNLTDFLQLPPERQAALRQLDRDIQAEDSVTSARLLRVLDRYVDWLNQLPEEDRQTVASADSNAERQQRIKQIRDREWILRQPKAVADQLVRLASVEQASRIAQLRKEEADFRTHWDAAILYQDQFSRIRSQPEKFADNLNFFIRESLEPVLSKEELKQLREVKDRWPNFEMKLVELADKHPTRLPGRVGIRTFDQIVAKYPGLPEDFKKSLKRAPTPSAAEGKWPDYAETVVAVAGRRYVELPGPLGECRDSEFAVPLRDFVKNELLPVLKPEERTSLQKQEGKWPAYPRTLLQLARNHGLQVPGMGLPWPKDVWESFRRKSATKHDFLPDVADRVLLDFADKELAAEERAALPSMSLSHPYSREEWKRAYFVRHPEILKQLKRQDIRKEKAARKG
ncbi:hypothetical protein BH10PLA2_BH10PLA2_09810 [soil metagenome]